MAKLSIESRSHLGLYLLLGAAVCVLSLLTFCNVVNAAFVPFDDDIQILTNPHVQGAIDWANLAWMFSDTHQAERYTPLSWLAWALIHQCFGLKAAAFHAEALIVHALNSVLVFMLLVAICRRLVAGGSERTVLVIAALGAAIWTVHPLRTEVVSWVTQVRFAEATALALLTVLLYLRSAAEGSPLCRPAFWGAVAAYAASVLFYPIGIGLIGILILLDFLPPRRFSTPRPTWREFLRLSLEKIPFIVPAALVGAMTVYGRFAQSHLFAAPTNLQQFGVASRMMQAAYLFLYYVWKPFDPTHISPVYTTLVNFHPWSPPFIASLAAFLAITAAAIACRRRFPAVTLIWMAHLALVFPVGGYFEHPYYPSDRYSYLQGVLWSVVIAAVLVHLWPRMRSSVRNMVVASLGILVLVFAFLSNVQSRIWHDGESLFQHLLLDLGNDPYAVDIHFRLGNYYLSQGRLEDAREQINASLKMSPDYPPAIHSEGLLFLKLAESARRTHHSLTDIQTLFLQAAQAFDREVRLNGSLEGMAYAGYAYAEAGQFEIASAALHLAIKQDANNVKYHLMLGQVHAMAGRMPEAADELDQAIRLAPTSIPNRDAVLSRWAQLAPPEPTTVSGQTR